MKHIILLILIALPSIAAQTDEIALKLTPAFGKTHFIIGAPTQQLLEQNPICLMPIPLTKGENRVLFSPDDDVVGALIDYINQEQTSIKVAIFSFTNKDIAHALTRAHERGVRIEVVVDSAYGRDKFSKIEWLKEAGIPVFCYNPANNKTLLSDIMHHKFMIFSKNKNNHSLVWTGSFNFTKSAAVNNQENVIVIDDSDVAKKYEQQFDRLKKRSSRHFCPKPRRKNNDQMVQAKKTSRMLLAQSKNQAKKS